MLQEAKALGKNSFKALLKTVIPISSGPFRQVFSRRIKQALTSMTNQQPTGDMGGHPVSSPEILWIKLHFVPLTLCLAV